MSYKRLPQSKRNELIAEYNEGIQNPDYDVIPSKTVKGKYTIRRKKPIEQEEEPQQERDEEPDEEVVTDENYNPYADDENYFPSFKMNKNAMFREMQMQMNRMFIEQMKVLRQQTKHYERKQQKMKDRTNRIHNVLQRVAESYDPEEEPEPEPVSEQPKEEEQPKQTYSLFDKEYEDNTPKKEPEPIPEPEPEPEKVYQNEYERDLDTIAGDNVQYYSRRNRLNFKNFPI